MGSKGRVVHCICIIVILLIAALAVTGAIWSK
jgi:hypothetical protein